jgi:hypothetical protein
MNYSKVVEREDGTRYRIHASLFNGWDAKRNRSILDPEFSVERAAPGSDKFDYTFNMYTSDLMRMNTRERVQKRNEYNFTLVSREEVMEAFNEMWTEIMSKV